MKIWARALLSGSALLVGYLGYQAFRWNRLTKVGAGLIGVAERFPKEYVLGGEPRSTLLILGDSTALGVGAERVEETMGHRIAKDLASHYGGQHVFDLGVSGACLSDVLHDQMRRRPPEAADVTLISLSANDVTHRTDPDLFERDLRRMLRGFIGHGERVVLTTTPNFETTPALPLLVQRLCTARAARLAKIVRQVASEYPFVRLADLNLDGTLAQDQFAADGFHPNGSGYHTWAEIALKAAEAK